MFLWCFYVYKEYQYQYHFNYPPDSVFEEDKGNRVSNLKKQISTTAWILDSYEVIRKLTRAPFLRQLTLNHQLKGFFKAAANKTIKYVFIYITNSTSSWSVPLLHGNYEKEYAFLEIHCKQVDSFLKSHVYEVNAWCWIHFIENSKCCDSFFVIQLFL